MSLYIIPSIKYNKDGTLKEYLIGKCDGCTLEIDNTKEPFITTQSNKTYHSKCYKGD